MIKSTGLRNEKKINSTIISLIRFIYLISFGPRYYSRIIVCHIYICIGLYILEGEQQIPRVELSANGELFDKNSIG